MTYLIPVTLSIFYSMIHPYLSYCNVIWAWLKIGAYFKTEPLMLLGLQLNFWLWLMKRKHQAPMPPEFHILHVLLSVISYQYIPTHRRRLVINIWRQNQNLGKVSITDE